MNQRWLWNFPEGPLLSPLLSLWLSIFNLNCSCNWLEGQQGGTLLVSRALPHGSQCAGSPLPLKKHFFLLQCRDFPPALDGLYSSSLACPSWLWQYKPEGIWKKKRPFGRLYLWLWCITQRLCYSTFAVLRCLRRRPTRFVQTLHISYQQCSLYI